MKRILIGIAIATQAFCLSAAGLFDFIEEEEKASAETVSTNTAPAATNAAPAVTNVAPVATNAAPVKKVTAPVAPKKAVPVKAVAPVATNAAPVKATNAAPVKATNAAPVKKAAAPVAPKKAVPAKAAKAAPTRPAKITSDKVVYDRKSSLAVFDRNVHVDDEEYQLHADKVYVFMQATNDIRRIVAIGHVAMTNETRRAYGAKVSYNRESGMVVLHSGDGIVAEVSDDAKGGDQTVRGDKIKFWIGQEQVEVMNATITAPRGGLKADDLKKTLK